jgi:hypothetical protein
MDPTLIVATHVYCFCMFSSVFLPLICFFHVGMTLGSLGNRKFGECEGFPLFGRASDDTGILFFALLRLPPSVALDRPLFFVSIFSLGYGPLLRSRACNLEAEEEVYVVNLNGLLTVFCSSSSTLLVYYPALLCKT